MKKSKYFLTFVSQRAAGGEIAADQTKKEWASEGERNTVVCKPERELRYQRQHMSVCMRGCFTSSRVAPQEFYH
ncbi:hypothetical protein [Claveliimonas sp.]|uniref:hypothetical protein n=1 Tax=Claveliimonas sp. TaxID=3076672 RepID=UPI00307CBA9F